MGRNVLLIEPNYKNKYPPIGLMKLATYHKKLGDNVRFFKGELSDLVVDDIYMELLKKLTYINGSVEWGLRKKLIIGYIKTSKKALLEQILDDIDDGAALIKDNLAYARRYYYSKEYIANPKYDRVCIATLFTFYWDKTIETIEFAKLIVKDKKNVIVGGVMASVIPDEIEKATGIKPFQGLLDKEGLLDDNNYIIDELPLDYSILDEIDYKYPESNGYYGYMTRGCKRKCPFCAVPIIEPNYKGYISLKNNIQYINNKFGEQRNLLLLDNNVLASKDFKNIIEEIKELGFYKGATFIEPNQYEIGIKNLKDNLNNFAYIRRLSSLLLSMLNRLRGEKQQYFYNVLERYSLLSYETTTKENLIASYVLLAEIYEKYRNKSPKTRYVDFNQGVDARYLTEEKVDMLSQIPIKPLRIAFDELKTRDKYEHSIRLAAKYGITDLSNYLLYNYEDKPEDLYERMRINVDLCEELDVKIYSFPMKYIPIYGDVSKNRDYLGVYWNKKFIRAVQAVLNATKGKIGRGVSFFEKAFGKNSDEFMKILYMPEAYIIYRLHYEDSGDTDRWCENFYALSEAERSIALPIIESDDFKNYTDVSQNIKDILQFYIDGKHERSKHSELYKNV